MGGCGPTDPMVTWLKKRLGRQFFKAVHPGLLPPPAFQLGRARQLPPYEAPVWDALYAANADVVLNGHDHDYERFAPQTPSGAADPARGIREFVVGTGGANLRPFKMPLKAHSESQNATAHGVLKLTLKATSYDWEFVPVAGKTFTDSGSASCHW